NETLDKMVEEYNNEQFDHSVEVKEENETDLDHNEMKESQIDDTNGIIDPLASLNENEDPAEPLVFDSPEDQLFVGEEDQKAKTQSDVLDLEDSEELNL